MSAGGCDADVSSAVYVWGRGGDGQLGQGDSSNCPVPTPVLQLGSQTISGRVSSIACGGKHTAAVTEGGEVFTWGWNWSGQLGHGDLVDHNTPCVVKTLALVKVLQKRKVVQVAAGNDHSLAVDDVGALYSWGGNDSGQLGVHPSSSQYQLVPRLVLPLHSRRVVKACCGSGHSVCLTGDGVLFAWGKAANGRLGLGAEVGEFVSSPSRVKVFGEGQVRDVVCGWSHTMCVAGEESELWSWGKGQDGQLGHGQAVDALEPKRVEFFSQAKLAVASCSGGYFHSAAITSEGALYTWGYGEHGQLGHGSTTSELLPRLVEGLVTTCAGVDCGGAHTLVRDISGRAFAFGSCDYGQLGVEPPAPESQPPVCMATTSKVLVPTRIVTLSKLRVTQIACGYWHSIAVVDDTPIHSSFLMLPPVPTTCPPRPDLSLEPPESISASVSPGLPVSGADPRVVSPRTPLSAAFPALRRASSSGKIEQTACTLSLTPSSSSPRPSTMALSSPTPAGSFTASTLSTSTLAGSTIGLRRPTTSGSGHSFLRKLFWFLFPSEAGTQSFCLREEQKTEAAESVWLKYVLPRWKTLKNSRSTVTMFRKGVPPRVRGQAWKLAIGNALGMTQGLFEVYNRHAREDAAKKGEDSTARSIEVDLPRTFPSLRYFSNATAPFYQQLMDVLSTWAQYRPDIGYVQGMSHVAGMLVLYLDSTFDAFCAFVNVLTDPLFDSFYKMDLDALLTHLRIYNLLFSENMPDLFSHFARHSVSPNYYLLEWVMTAFTHVLPMPIASRVLDCYVVEGEVIVHRAALTILRRHRDALLAEDFEGIVGLLHRIPQETPGPPEREFVEEMFSIQVPPYIIAAFQRLHTHSLQSRVNRFQP